MKLANFFGLAILASLIAVTSFVAIRPGQAADPIKPSTALERARREVRMLDDIYKTSIVLITTHYVDGKESLPPEVHLRRYLKQ